MSRLPFVLVVASLVLAGIAYPVYQWITNAGWVYYLNGYDEYTYLQYDYSLSAQAITRPGQYVVSLAHRAGLSGGMINLILDLAALIAFPLLVAAAWRCLGWDSARARSAALIMLGLPLFAGGINPLIDQLNQWNIQSGMIYWLTAPHLHTPAIVRTPEPQFSLFLLALVVLGSLRWRSFWPVYAALPFMYPFVAIPAAFVALACDLQQRWPAAWRWPNAGPLMLAFLGVSCVITVYFNLLVPVGVRDIMVATRLPLVSFTGAVTLALAVVAWRHIPQAMRFPALAIALAPWAAANHQWLSGHVAQPNNVEQYFGTLGMALVVALATFHTARWRAVALALAIALFLRSSYVTFRTNQISNDSLPLSPALLDSLRRDPAHTAINDVHMASVMNLVLPRQGPTTLSYAQTFTGLADRHVRLYRCAKQRILAEQSQDNGFVAAIEFLDSGYAYGGQNIPLLSIFRKVTFKHLYDVNPEGCEAPSPPLRYFYITR